MTRSADRLFARFRRTGDPRAVAELFDLCAPDLWRVASYLLRDENAVADAVQATFLAAIEDAARFDAARRVLPWLIGILTNYARAQRRREARGQPLLDEHATPDAGPPAVAADRELLAEVAAALPRLAAPYRAVVEQTLVQQQTPAQISRALGVRENTVSVRLHRGLRQLRRLLPAGFARGAVGAVPVPAARLEVIRQQVLGHAGAPAVPIAVSAPALVLAGILTMKKTLLVGACAALVAFAGWLAMCGGEAPSGSAAAGPPATLVAVQSATVAAAAQPGLTEPAVRTPIVAPSAALGRARVRVVNAKTQAPVPHVHVEWLGKRVLRGVTDSAGEWLVEAEVGSARVALQHMGGSHERRCELSGEREAIVLFELRPDVSVQVRAVDRAQRPLAGARVFGTVHPGHLRHQQLGVTDHDGWFRHESVWSPFEAWVEADGYLPSAMLGGHAERAPAVRETVVLDGAAGTLRGRVLDTAGVPLAACLVALQPASTPPAIPSTAANPPRVLLVTTDAEGRFAARSVPPGEVEVFALADRRNDQGGFLQPQRRGRARAQVTAGAATDIDVWLASTRVVVTVPPRALDVARESLWLQIAEPGLDGDLANELSTIAMVTEWPRGEIAGLAPGHYVLRVRSQNREASVEFDLAADQTFHWHAPLEPAGTLRLQVLGRDGQQMTGIAVALRREDGRDTGSISYVGMRDEAWAWQGIADVAYEVRVTAAADGSAVAQFAGVRPSPERQILRVEAPAASTPASAGVRGRIVAEGGALPPGVVVKLGRVRDQTVVDDLAVAVGHDGAFARSGLAAGEYVVRVFDGRAPLDAWARLTLVAGATTDVGMLHVRASGGVRVRVLGRAAPAAAGLCCFVRVDEIFREVPQVVEADRIAISAMPVGAWDLLVWGPGVAPTRTHVRVAANQTAEVDVALQSAPSVTFELDGAPFEPDTVAFRQAGHWFAIAPQPGHNRLELGLPAGTWSVERRGGREAAVTDAQTVVTGEGSTALVTLRSAR